MLFNSYIYPAFLLLTVCIYWLLPAQSRMLFLIVIGMIFYALHSTTSLLLVIILCTIVYWALHSNLPKASLITIVVVIGTLCVFKYGNALFNQSMFIIMPIGISFFSFEFLHLLFDKRNGKISTPTLKEFLTFTFFFPSLLAGPIRRYQQFMPFTENTNIKPEYMYYGILLIIGGYTQKYLLADPLIPFTSTLAHPSALTTQMSAAIGLLLYSFRIYFDFAGLSNIAIGSALLFGIPLPKNFHWPYLSCDIQQFWRRWHMSLGNWVRDYIYIPLGGSRVSISHQVVNLCITMTIVGIWHGAGWNFAYWGLWHGLGLSGRILWKKICPWNMPTIPSILLTFCFVTIGWVFFVTDSLENSLLLLSRIFGIV